MARRVKNDDRRDAGLDRIAVLGGNIEVLVPFTHIYVDDMVMRDDERPGPLTHGSAARADEMRAG